MIDVPGKFKQVIIYLGIFLTYITFNCYSGILPSLAQGCWLCLLLISICEFIEEIIKFKNYLKVMKKLNDKLDKYDEEIRTKFDSQYLNEENKVMPLGEKNDKENT